MADFEHARDKVLMGPKREEVLTDKEKEKTAYHEAGHTLLAWQLARLAPRSQGDDRAPRPLAGQSRKCCRRKTA